MLFPLNYPVPTPAQHAFSVIPPMWNAQVHVRGYTLGQIVLAPEDQGASSSLTVIISLKQKH